VFVFVQAESECGGHAAASMWGPRMGPGDPAAAAALAGMLPFDSIGLYEQPKPRFIFKMPRVVPDQKSKFESDELFRRLSRESEVKLKTSFISSTKIIHFESCEVVKKVLNGLSKS